MEQNNNDGWNRKFRSDLLSKMTQNWPCSKSSCNGSNIHKNFSFNFNHHHQLNVHFLPRSIKGMDSCFPTASDRQPTVSNTRDFLFSHSNASISSKSRLVTIRQLSIHGNVRSKFLVVGCPSCFLTPTIKLKLKDEQYALNVNSQRLVVPLLLGPNMNWSFLNEFVQCLQCLQHLEWDIKIRYEVTNEFNTSDFMQINIACHTYKMSRHRPVGWSPASAVQQTDPAPHWRRHGTCRGEASRTTTSRRRTLAEPANWLDRAGTRFRVLKRQNNNEIFPAKNKLSYTRILTGSFLSLDKESYTAYKENNFEIDHRMLS